MGEVKFVVTGDYIEKIITQFGTVSAFVIGAKLAAGFLVKHPMSLTGKVGTSLLTGGASSITFQMASLGNGLIRGKVEATESSNNTLTLEVKNVEISNTKRKQSLIISLILQIS